MEETEGANPTSASPKGQGERPSWILREDARARRENRADQAQGYHYLWTVIFYLVGPALVALGALLWRLVR